MTSPVSRVYGGAGSAKAMATAVQALAVADATADQTAAAVVMAQTELAKSTTDRSAIWTRLNANMSRLNALEQALALLGSSAGSDSVAALLPVLNDLKVRMDALEREPGPAGDDGVSVELMAGGEGVLWRQTGGQWQTLFTFAQIRGADGVDGRSPELGVDQGSVGWRFAGGQWHPLVQVADLVGAAGRDGTNGRDGSNGSNGTNGSDGATPQLRAGVTGIESRLGAGSWSVLVPYSSITGPKGADGVNGSNGSNGQDGRAGVDGVNGTNGVDGLSPQLRAGVTGIESRTGGGSWSVLVPFSSITGPKGADGSNGVNGTNGSNGTNGVDGATPQLRAGATGIEWRVGTGSWSVLVPFSSITGPKGADGTNGTNGVKGADGANGVKGADGTAGAKGVDVTNFRIGVASCPLILLNTSQDVTIEWDTAMPSDVYEVRLAKGALIGKGTVVKKSQTSAAVVVTVTSTALAISAGTLVAATARS